MPSKLPKPLRKIQNALNVIVSSMEEKSLTLEDVFRIGNKSLTILYYDDWFHYEVWRNDGSGYDEYNTLEEAYNNVIKD